MEDQIVRGTLEYELAIVMEDAGFLEGTPMYVSEIDNSTAEVMLNGILYLVDRNWAMGNIVNLPDRPKRMWVHEALQLSHPDVKGIARNTNLSDSDE